MITIVIKKGKKVLYKEDWDHATWDRSRELESVRYGPEEKPTITPSFRKGAHNLVIKASK